MFFSFIQWYETACRRAVIDMHIPDWDDKFLSEFNADAHLLGQLRDEIGKLAAK